MHDIHPLLMMLTLRALALAAAVAAPHARAARVQPARFTADTLHVVLVVDDTAARRSLVHGAQLGAEEASRTGALFGTVVTLRVESRAAFDGRPRASGDAIPGATPPSLYVVAADSGTCSRVVLQSAALTIPVLDAGCPSMDQPPAATRYSLVPAASLTSAAGDSDRVELWHWSLDRFGGEQLNERFRRRFNARMDSPAWTGWLALKIALDAALHAKATNGPALLRQLADPRAQYDGQKGRPLRFAAETHRLVQPLYRVAGRGDAEHVVAEVAP